MLLSRGGTIQKDHLWWATLGWLLVIVISAFFIRPVQNAALYMWFLTAMPMLALCLRKDDLPSYLAAFGGVLGLYALGLLIQWGLNVHYTNFDYRAGPDARPQAAWPLLDPNNAAALLNMAFIPCVWLATKRPRWILGVLLFGAALYVTRSKAGWMAAGIACTILLAYRYDIYLRFVALIAGILAVCATPFIDHLEPIRASFAERLPIWKASMSILAYEPWRGIGLGQFGAYYAKVRTETNTVGSFAHNDILQFAIEMGLFAAVAIGVLIAITALRTWKGNAVSACVMLAVLLQALVEFQFYLPCISLAMGVALAYHRLNQAPDPYENYGRIKR